MNEAETKTKIPAVQRERLRTSPEGPTVQFSSVQFSSRGHDTPDVRTGRLGFWDFGAHRPRTSQNKICGCGGSETLGLGLGLLGERFGF